MIAISLTSALALYSGILGLLAVGIWIYTEFSAQRVRRVLEKQYLWHCIFCGYSYLDDSGQQLSECPRCGSINSTQDKHAREVAMPAPASRLEPASAQAADSPQGGTSKRKKPTQRRRGPRKRR